jgi:regulator of sigma E protease
MSGILGNIFYFVIAISVLVAVHEYGHYIVGRWCGMKVLRFSIGFGKPLISWRGAQGETEYCISSIPLGGYVKFLDEREGPIDEADRGRAFTDRPIPARIAVLLAGPAFNFAFAVIAYFALFVYGVPTVKPQIGAVAGNSYAAEAGLQYGDRILEVGGRAVVDWESALVGIMETMVGDGRIELRVRGEDGFERTATIDVGDDATRLTEPGQLFDGLGFAPWQPPAVVGALVDGGAAEAAGLQEGDRITEIAGEPVSSFADLSRIVAARPGESVTLAYVRRGATARTEVTLAAVDVDGERRGQLGISLSQSDSDYWYLRKYPVPAAVTESLQQTWASTKFTVNMFMRMLTGQVSAKNISGPINIAQYAGSSASAGMDQFLRFLALVSISLGVINLIPLPILDGGQIVYQSIEWIKGSPLSMRSQVVGQQVGILALLLLMSFAFYNDIARILVEK